MDIENTVPPGSHDLPLPGPVLRNLVAGTDDANWFLEIGRQGARTIQSILEKHGMSLAHAGSVLDFGCGCGRVMRHLQGYPSVRLHGCDINPDAVDWCRTHLEYAEFQVNHLHPPTVYDEHSFDLVYAFSVLTHLTAPLQKPWMGEFRRILKPGGHLILTVHGDYYLPQLSKLSRIKYRLGSLVVTGRNKAGSNHCGAYHPERYVRRVLAGQTGFKIVDYLPEGALGNPRQDAFLLRSEAPFNY